VISEGAKQISKGNRPKVNDLLLTPANAKRLTKQLATMRGAAMKVGQLLSMETSDFLPPELAEILSQLNRTSSSCDNARWHQNCIKNTIPGSS